MFYVISYTQYVVKSFLWKMKRRGGKSNASSAVPQKDSKGEFHFMQGVPPIFCYWKFLEFKKVEEIGK